MKYKITNVEDISFYTQTDDRFRELLDQSIDEEIGLYYEKRVRELLKALHDIYQFLELKRPSKIKEDTQKLVIDKISELNWRYNSRPEQPL